VTNWLLLPEKKNKKTTSNSSQSTKAKRKKKMKEIKIKQIFFMMLPLYCHFSQRKPKKSITEPE
jgi:hypothetical protein